MVLMKLRTFITRYTLICNAEHILILDQIK